MSRMRVAAIQVTTKLIPQFEILPLILQESLELTTVIDGAS